MFGIFWSGRSCGEEYADWHITWASRKVNPLDYWLPRNNSCHQEGYSPAHDYPVTLEPAWSAFCLRCFQSRNHSLHPKPVGELARVFWFFHGTSENTDAGLLWGTYEKKWLGWIQWRWTRTAGVGENTKRHLLCHINFFISGIIKFRIYII